jgi:hypothetical protein
MFDCNDCNSLHRLPLQPSVARLAAPLSLHRPSAVCGVCRWLAALLLASQNGLARSCPPSSPPSLPRGRAGPWKRTQPALLRSPQPPAAKTAAHAGLPRARAATGPRMRVPVRARLLRSESPSAHPASDSVRRGRQAPPFHCRLLPQVLSVSSKCSLPLPMPLTSPSSLPCRVAAPSPIPPASPRRRASLGLLSLRPHATNHHGQSLRDEGSQMLVVATQPLTAVPAPLPTLLATCQPPNTAAQPRLAVRRALRLAALATAARACVGT